MDMVLSTRRPDQEGDESNWPHAARIFVALSNTNSVCTCSGFLRSAALRLIERINAGLYSNQPAGMTPSALALSADGKRLAVAVSDANAAASVDVSRADGPVLRASSPQAGIRWPPDILPATV